MANRDIRVDMAQLGIKGVEIIRHVNKNYGDFKYSPADLSNALSGMSTSPKAEKLLERARAYINELYRQKKEGG